MPIPYDAKQLNRSLMRDEVYSTLLQWIMEGELRPGEKLLDTELAENLGVSRTPVREALRRLEDKALVEAAANRWTRVTKITVDAAELIYPIIWSLEPLAPARLTTYRSGDILSRIVADIETLEHFYGAPRDQLEAVLVEAGLPA